MPSKDVASVESGVVSFGTAYGLNLRSEVDLPELVDAKGAADVEIRFGSVNSPRLENSESGLIWATDDEVCLFFSEIGTFLVRQGREIVVDPAPEADQRWVRSAVLGPGIGALLYQRGWLTLHASAASVGDRVVAFMAERGWGKSTMAAALCARGHRLIADDITAVEHDGSRHRVSPGYPILKLWPEAAVSVGEDPDALLPIEPGNYRRGLVRAREGFSSDALSLGCVYVLAQGDAPKIVPLERQQALVETIRNTYGRKLFQAVRQSSHLRQCADVVNGVPVRRLERPDSLPALSEVARMVEEDLAQLAGGQQR